MKQVLYGCFYCTRCSSIFNGGYRSVHINRIHLATNKNQSKCQLISFKNSYIVNNKLIKGIQPFNVNYIHRSSFHSVIQAYMSVFQALSESSAVVCTQNFLVNVHETSGLPWWATIAATTVLIRTSVTLPLGLYQQYILAKVENLKPELQPIIKELQKEIEIATKMYNWSPRKATIIFQRSLQKQWRLLLERDNCHPAKASIIILFQLPMWVIFSMSIRNLVFMRPVQDEAAVQIYDQLKNEGLLWISDLTVPDGTLIIPSALCLVSLSIIEVNRLMYSDKPTTFRRVLTYFFRFFAFLTFPFGLIVPSCLSFYWLTSALVGLCQNLVLMSPRIKLLAGIPRTSTTKLNPYRHLWKQIQTRIPGTSKSS